MRRGGCKVMQSVALRNQPVNENHKQAARAAWAEFLGRMPWDYFGTLTVDPKRFPRMGEEGWHKAWEWFLHEWWMQSARACGGAWKHGDRWRGPMANEWRKGKRRPQWVQAIEPHRDGRPHCHTLIKLSGQLQRLDYSIGHRIWNENRGFGWFEKPRSQQDVADYCSKYVTKHEYGSGALTLSPNLDIARMAVVTAA